MLMMGLGGGVISTSTNTLASDIGGAGEAGMLNFLNVFFGVGGLITPALGAIIRITILSRLIALLALFALVLHGTMAMPPRSSGGRGFSGGDDARRLLRLRFLSLAFFLFLYVAAELGVWNWYASFLISRNVPRPTALRIISFGFATGIITGRLLASRLTGFRPATITLACAILMTIATTAMLRANGTPAAATAVFFAGLAMAPVYPTTLALVGEAFPRGTATAIGIAVTVGWVGVAVSSKLIGLIAGGDAANLGKGLLVIPAFSALMVLLSLTFRRPASAVAADPQH
jgi:fucose permease